MCNFHSAGRRSRRRHRAWGLHVRTLQRQLSADGVAFSELVNEVRRDLVLRYLAQPGHRLTWVAEQAGYGQLSSFTRRFISQFQATPSEWTRRMRHGGPATGR